jgi:hypothetical protein
VIRGREQYRGERNDLDNGRRGAVKGGRRGQVGQSSGERVV